jgi:Fe-S cluster biogenesis protein NfuA
MFAIDGVDTLFFCDRFVTVTMKDDADWRAVHAEATRLLEAAAPAEVDPGTASVGAPASLDPSQFTPADRELLERIQALLDDRVRPALAGDGGGLEVVGLDGKTLHIRYQGACGSCPSSVSGTLMAIQNLLQSEVDEDIAVVPA